MPYSGPVHARSGTLATILAGTGGFCDSPLYRECAARPVFGRVGIFKRLISKRKFLKHG